MRAGIVVGLVILLALGLVFATRGTGTRYTGADHFIGFIAGLLRGGGPAIGYLIGAIGLGRLARRALLPRASGAVATAMGISIMLTMSHLFGVVGLMRGTSGVVLAWAPIAVGLIALALEWQTVQQEVTEASLSIWSVPATVIASAVLIAAALAPPGMLWGSEFGGYDVLSYHLQLPQEWLAAGRIWPSERNVYSFHPLYVEAAYYHLGVMTLAPLPGHVENFKPAPWGLAAFDGWRLVSAQFLHAGLTLVSAWLISALAGRLALGVLPDGADREARSAQIGLAAGALYLATPWTIVVGSMAYNEMGMMAMFAGAMLAASESNLRPWVRGALAGWLVGIACGCKATALLLAGVPVGVMLIAATPRRVLAGTLGAGTAAGLLALAPWLVRNYLACGNPVFPAATGLFGTSHWTGEQVERFRAAHIFGGGAFERLKLMVAPDAKDPMGPTHRGLAHPQWFLFFAIAIVSAAVVLRVRRLRVSGWAIVAGLGLQLVLWLTTTHIQSRFLIPLALPGVVAAALAASLAAAWAPRLLAALSLVQALALGAIYLDESNGNASLLLPVGPAEFTGDAYWHRLLSGSPSERATYLDRASPEVFATFSLGTDSRLLLVGSATPLYYSLPTLYSTTWDTSILVEVMREAPNQPERWSRMLIDRGITHMMMNVAELQRLKHSGFLDPLLDPERNPSLEEWLRRVPMIKQWPTSEMVADIRESIVPEAPRVIPGLPTPARPGPSLPAPPSSNP